MTTMNTRAGAPSRTSLAQRAITVAAAAVAAVAVRLVAQAVTSEPLTVSFGGAEAQEVAVASVLLTAAVAGLLGWALLALLERVAPTRAATVWTAVAAVVLILSLGGPISAAASTGTTAALVAMHLVVGVVLIARLPRRD